MKRIKNNKIVDLKNKTEYEKAIKLGELSKEINSIFNKKLKSKSLEN